MLHHQVPSPDRRAVKVARTTWLDQWGAPGLFLMALGFCALSFGHYLSTPHARQPVRAKARTTIDVFSLHRTPTIAAGKFRYAVLGYGQDEMTGAQIVWMRSISTNRIGGFKAGDRLFEGPVKLAAIEPDRVILNHLGEAYEVPVHP